MSIGLGHLARWRERSRVAARRCDRPSLSVGPSASSGSNLSTCPGRGRSLWTRPHATTFRVPQPYDAFAPHFDAWQRAFGGAYDDLILPRVLAALARHPRPVCRVVDLGIGTGDLVVALARAGYAV